MAFLAGSRLLWGDKGAHGLWHNAQKNKQRGLCDFESVWGDSSSCCFASVGPAMMSKSRLARYLHRSVVSVSAPSGSCRSGNHNPTDFSMGFAEGYFAHLQQCHAVQCPRYCILQTGMMHFHCVRSFGCLQPSCCTFKLGQCALKPACNGWLMKNKILSRHGQYRMQHARLWMLLPHR